MISSLERRSPNLFILLLKQSIMFEEVPEKDFQRENVCRYVSTWPEEWLHNKLQAQKSGGWVGGGGGGGANRVYKWITISPLDQADQILGVQLI